MKHIFIGVVTLGLISGGIYLNKTKTVVYAQAEEAPRVILIGTTTKEKTVEEKIRATFPEEPEIAVAVAKAESQLNATAVNPERHKNCSGSIGLMQIACIHVENPETLKDIDTNLQVARKIYDRQGWKPWGVCKDGKVDCGI